MMKHGILVLACGLSLALTACARKPTVDDVVAKMVQSQGGAQALSAITDQVTTWESRTVMAMGDSTTTLTSETVITYKRPDKIKFEGRNPDGSVSFASVYDGSRGWQYVMGQETREMTPAELEETACMAETWIDGWYNHASRGIKLALLGDTTLQGRSYTVVQSTDRFGNVARNYCDPQTGLVERTESFMVDPTTQEKKPGVMEMTDYAKVNGFMIARKVAQFDDQGQLLYESILKEVQNNIGVGEEAFAAPEPSAPMEGEPGEPW